MSWRERTRVWFVEYNPLYFASALCVFAGVWLVAEGLPPERFASKLALAGVTQLYQGLLLAGAFFLLRAGQRRPAALLGLVTLVFTLDVACDAERLFSHARTMSLAPGMRARVALPASLAFAALGPLKLALLVRLFRLQGAWPFMAVAGAFVFGLPLFPYVVEAAGPDHARRLAHLGITWLGAPLLGWALTRPGWRLGASDGLRARRIARAAPGMVLGLFLVHVILWSTYPGLSLSTAHVAPYLLVASVVLARRGSGLPAEITALAGALLALGAALEDPEPAGAMAVLCGAALLALVHRRGFRLLLPSILFVFLGAYLFPQTRLGPPSSAFLFALAGTLSVAAAGRREVGCAVAAGAALAAALGGSVPHAWMAGALWTSALSWLFLPERRAWLPCAALAAFLVAGAVPLFREPALHAAPCLGVAILALGLGVAYRRLPYTLVGAAGLAGVALLGFRMYVPTTTLGWGLWLVGFGFAFLLAGVLFNLRQRPASS